MSLVRRVRLDCNQYREDMDLTSQGAEDVYASFNILMRRKPKENNFKAVLETIRQDMINAEVNISMDIHIFAPHPPQREFQG